MITDIVMPDTTGVDLARTVRERWPALPILFASGYADVKTFGDELTDETVLKKPFRVAEVAERIRDMLDPDKGRNVIAFPRR